MAELEDGTEPQKTDPAKRDKRDVVQATDGAEHVSDDQSSAENEPLTAEVSADVAPTVGEFMEQAAQQNEAAAEAVPDIKTSLVHISRLSMSISRSVTL